MDKIRIPLRFVNEIVHCHDNTTFKIFEEVLADGSKIQAKLIIAEYDDSGVPTYCYDFHPYGIEHCDCIRIPLDFLREIESKSVKQYGDVENEIRWDFEMTTKLGNRLVAKVRESGYHAGSGGMFGVMPGGDHSYTFYSVDFEYNTGND